MLALRGLLPVRGTGRTTDDRGEPSTTTPGAPNRRDPPLRTDGGQQLVHRPSQVLTQDTLFSTLSSQRRRLALRRLFETGQSLSVRELTTGVAADENGIPEPELTYKQRKRVYTSLHQTHLPKLDDVGLIDYDSNRGTVALTDAAATVRPYLFETDDRPWFQYYTGVGVGVAALALFMGADVAMFAAFPDILVGGMGAAAVLAVAAWHAVTTRSPRPRH